MLIDVKGSLHHAHESATSSLLSTANAIFPLSRARLRYVSRVALSFLTLTAIVTSWFRIRRLEILHASQLSDSRTPELTGYKKEHGSFHLAIPANHVDVNLCKTILSAKILGYPSPTILNWGKTFDNASVMAGGSHAAKLNGVLEYLRQFDASHDEDLVLIVDAYDVWFQLGPKVLIDRYQATNDAANLRFGTQSCGELEQDCALQKVVFSAQKACWPGNDSYDMSCYAIPESSLPQDLFGRQLDLHVDKPTDDLHKKRARFLNSGTVIGPVATLRALYEGAALQLAASPSNLGSDQAILADFFGAQEYQRAVKRHNQQPFWKRLTHRLTLGTRQRSGKYNVIDPHPTRQTPDVRPGTRFEFGIGLDYTSSLSQATIFSEKDSQWVHFKNPGEIIRAATELKIGTLRAMSLSTDIAASLRPFSTEAGAIEDDVPQPGWEDVPLYTNLWTGVTPAIIHHNAWADDLKTVREKAWDRMWFQPYAREMLEARFEDTQRARRLIAVDNRGKAWWSDIEATLGEEEIASPSITWEGLCPNEYSQEIFRDGKGELWSEG